MPIPFYITTIRITNTNGYTLLMPKCCEELIWGSNAITEIDLSGADFGSTENYEEMIARNENLEKIGQENKLHINNCNASSLRKIIYGNKKLDNINLSIKGDQLRTFEKIIDSNDLSQITLDTSKTKMSAIFEISKLIVNRRARMTIIYNKNKTSLG